MIRGIGIDLIEVARIERALDEHGDRFLARIFTADEITHALRLAGRARLAHLAGRFAAKEAAVKALGTGIARGVGFLDVEIRADAASGAPSLSLRGEALALATRIAIDRTLVSITHTDTHAAAVVVLEKA